MAQQQRKSAKTPKLDAPVTRTHRARLILVVVFFLAAYAAIGYRLVEVQTDPDVRFSKQDLAHIGRIVIHRPRGDILDRTGRTLATDRKVHSLTANPSRVHDPEQLIRFLVSRLDIDAQQLRDRLAARDAKGKPMKFVWVKRYLSQHEVDALGDLDQLPEAQALRYQEERLRFYPNGELAAHVLGFANREGKGQEGIEFQFDKYLSSLPGRRVSRVDRNRHLLNFLTLEYEPPSGGDDLRLTLDAALQHMLETALDAALELREGRYAMGVMMDPKTGAVLALATRPAFDPNAYWDYTAEQRKNRAVVDVFEPGSSFKIVTASAALELGLITPDDGIDCEGGIFNPYGHQIEDTHQRGIIPFSQCFAESSNIAMIKVAAMLGEERLEEWIRRFGFAQHTNIELPQESRGIFFSRKHWSRLTMGSLPMGQEIAINMIQLARGFAVLANGGYLVQPHIVQRATDQEGDITYQFAAPDTTQILSPETATTMKALCHQVVVGKESTGRYAAIQEFRVGGKTGTAQIARPREEGGGYYKRKYTAVFAGFAPIADPRLVCVIVMREPKYGQHWGGTACGPVFKEVVRKALIHLNVPEDPMRGYVANAEKEQADHAPVVDADTVVARLELDLFEPIDENPPGGDDLNLRHTSQAQAKAGPRLPSFVGLTKREALAKLVDLGLPWDPKGAGRVVTQNPGAGTLLDEVTICQLTFATGETDEV